MAFKEVDEKDIDLFFFYTKKTLPNYSGKANKLKYITTNFMIQQM